jgi:transcriptional regulator with XRE-family HTH domain
MAQTLERAIEADEIIAALRTYSFTQADIATAVGVTDRAVRDWLHEKPLRRGNEERLQALRQIVLLLDDSLSRRGVGQWFRAHNRSLGGRRPLDVLAEDDFDAVRQAAAAFADGAYV